MKKSRQNQITIENFFLRALKNLCIEANIFGFFQNGSKQGFLSIGGAIFWFFSLNQDQRIIFTVRECAQSILRLEKPKNRRLSHKNPKMFDFRFNTHTTFPESGARKRFHASGMPTIDSPHKITPRK